MNAGVREALKENDYHCFVFHDVDLIPEDDRNMYSCPLVPRHLSVAVDKFNYSYVYPFLLFCVSFEAPLNNTQIDCVNQERSGA